MKKSTKWLIGILIGVLVLILLASITILIINTWQRNMWVWDRGIFNWRDGFEVQGKRMWVHPPFYLMPQRGFFGIFPIGGIFSWILNIGLIGLVVLGIILLVRNLTRPSQPVTAQPIQTVVSQPPENVETSSKVEKASSVPASVPTSIPTCTNCAYPIQAGWKHCPNCGINLQGNIS